MSNLTIDLRTCDIFKDDQLEIDKKVSFVFGKNGTGKSTLAKLIQEQNIDYDVRIFDGFDGVVGESRKLNAVILGEKNNEIDNEIKKIETEISKINEKIILINSQIEKSEKNPENIFMKYEKAREKFEKQDKKISNFFKESAAKIKHKTSPQISKPTYNYRDFQREIFKTKILSDEEAELKKSILNTETKEATQILNEKIDLKKYLEEVNKILKKKVEEKERILEISGDKEKIEFVEKGLKLHKSNDKCLFCGNILTQERYKRIENYFSADEVKEFREKIKNYIDFLEKEIEYIEKIKFKNEDFYPKFKEEINELEIVFLKQKGENLKFLRKIKFKMEDKLKDLFEESIEYNIEIPESIDNTIQKYNELVMKNNSSDLEKSKSKAQEELRFHEIKFYLNKFNYEKENNEFEILKSKYKDAEKLLKDEESKKINFQEEIKKLENGIKKLELQTKNENKLADEINERLKLYVNFELEYVEEDSSYKIKNKRTGSLRNVEKLSTGEKTL